jgi:hypothetical protein
MRTFREGEGEWKGFFLCLCLHGLEDCARDSDDGCVGGISLLLKTAWVAFGGSIWIL